MMRLPRRAVGRDAASSDPVQHIDLLPTLAALAGLPVPRGPSRPRSVGRALRSRHACAPQGIYAEALYPRYHFGWSELLSLTDDRYRYIKAPREELYDLERDPGERTNIAGERGAGGRRRCDRRSTRSSRAATSTRRPRCPTRIASGWRRSATSARNRRPRRQTATTPRRSQGQSAAPSHLSAGGRGDRRRPAGRRRARCCAQILDDDPAMTDVWSQYAAALGRLGRYQDAFEAYAQRHPAAARRAQRPARRGEHAARAEPARRRARARRAGAQASAPSQAHQALALIEVARSATDEALRQAELAAKAEPGLPMPAFIRGTIAYNRPALRARRSGACSRREQGYAQRSAQPRDLHFMIGDSLARLERYAEAEPYLKEEVRSVSAARARARQPGDAVSVDGPDGARPSGARPISCATCRRARRSTTAARVWRMFGRPDRAAAIEARAARGEAAAR